MELSTIINERPIEKVAVVCDKDCGLNVSNVLKKLLEDILFIGFVEDGEQSLIFCVGRILEIVDVFRYNLSICNEESLIEGGEGGGVGNPSNFVNNYEGSFAS